ncbi:MAG: NAD-dependent malic enzyme [Rhodobiaceae bacterium]|nr:MAG: NAD-dependent malic enzyme [Rhodobiaceae bacterium]
MRDFIGQQLLNDRALTKSTAFSKEERRKLRLRGLLPYNVVDMDTQLIRVLENMRRKEFDIERYIFLSSLQERNQTLFYRTLIDNIEEIMPLIYTPTVGQACREFAHIFRKPQGFYITPEDKGDVAEILDNWPEKDIRIIVVTDGERILGLGDLGANGMGIPIGKLALYVACAGIQPHQCLPVMLDVGTNNRELREDPLYLGYPFARVQGEAYDELVEEFVSAVQVKFPKALIQFEDFLTPNAYRLLHTYRDRVLCFNDDIQGTAAVALAGIYASTRISKKAFTDLKIMFLGAGSAATGIADLICEAFKRQGLSEEAARKKLWFVDVNGLVIKGRDDLMSHNLPYAHDHAPADFVSAIDAIKPDILIGATGAPGTFTREVVERMAALNDRPVIFALSNPTSRAECTAEQAYEWSGGRVIFASGSPFEPVSYAGAVHRPAQGNNAYVFPGIGLGAVIADASLICDEMFLAAADALAGEVTEDDLAHGAVYPRLSVIRDVSAQIALKVAQTAHAQGLAKNLDADGYVEAIKNYMYDPTYDGV